MKWINNTLLIVMIIIINSVNSAILDTIVLQEGLNEFVGWQDATIRTDSVYVTDNSRYLKSEWDDVTKEYKSFLIKVALPSIPEDATIQNVTLTLSCYDLYSFNPFYTYVYRVTSQWNEDTLNYNNRPRTTSLSGFEFKSNEQYASISYDINVTSLVRGFYNNSYDNEGFYFRTLDRGLDSFNRTFFSKDYYDVSKRPKLVIIYSLPGDTPKVVSPIEDLTVNEDTSEINNYVDCKNVFDDAEDSSSLTYTVFSNSNSSLLNVSINSDSGIDISFSQNQFGTASIIIQAEDKENNIVQDTFIVTVNSVNDTPVAVSDNIIVDEGASVSVLQNGENSVLDNDTDVDGMDGVSVILVENSSHGTVALNADGTFLYGHNGSENFVDSFKYKVSDGDLESDIVSVFIIVNPINDNSPIASRDTIKINQGESSTVLANGMSSVLSNDFDIDINEVLSVKIFNDVFSGFLTLNSDGTFEYLHDGSSNFNDSFSYVVIDNAENSDTETVSIIIDPKTNITVKESNSQNRSISFEVVPTVVEQGGVVSFIVNGEFNNLKVDAFIYDALGNEIYSDKYRISSSQRRENYVKFGIWDMSKNSMKSIKNQSLLVLFRVYKTDGTFLGTEKCLIGVKKIN